MSDRPEKHVLVGIAIGVVVGAAVGTRLVSPVGPLRYGDLGTWAAAIATLLAVVVALWASTEASREIRRKEVRRAVRRGAAKLLQARVLADVLDRELYMVGEQSKRILANAANDPPVMGVWSIIDVMSKTTWPMLAKFSGDYTCFPVKIASTLTSLASLLAHARQTLPAAPSFEQLGGAATPAFVESCAGYLNSAAGQFTALLADVRAAREQLTPFCGLHAFRPPAT